jgi:hypothetical protein
VNNTYQKTGRRAQPDRQAGEIAVPEQVIVSMAEIAESAKEGLLALAVGTGLHVMAAMFDEDVARHRVSDLEGVAEACQGQWPDPSRRPRRTPRCTTSSSSPRCSGGPGRARPRPPRSPMRRCSAAGNGDAPRALREMADGI